ncbi:hypothetical protein GGS20DRAFT_576214 [Poronia punctata]|nr:hypothetical protein GGS20DRAFT_576214 [Poronia punctata]
MEEAREPSVSADQQSVSFLRRFTYPATWNRPATAPPATKYPSISSIPKISPERLALASTDDDDDNPSSDSTKKKKTILYLAYGSNLSAQTFLGMRGIRPLSQINVSAPAFDLVFNLPGMPYMEPCFANTRPRQIPNNTPTPAASTTQLLLSPSDRGPTWSKGVYGVVYEVTPEDYATIIKTEGGGQGYQDVLTPCFELPPDLHVPEKPVVPRPFLAHTLYAPDLSHEEGQDRKGFPGRLFTPIHRNDAQPSARYLKLIRDGAREHGLPEDYQTYLSQLRSYTVTRTRQYIGRILFLLFFLPLVGPFMVLGRLLADESGRTPRWLALGTTAAVNVSWIAYDCFFRPLFGDGERTMTDDGDCGDDGFAYTGRRMVAIMYREDHAIVILNGEWSGDAG